MRKEQEQENILKLNTKLQEAFRKKNRGRQKSSPLKKKLIKFAEQSQEKIVQNSQHNIYDQCMQTPDVQDSQSSFQLDDQYNTNKKIQQKQTIDKVLARLGLNKKTKKKQNEELEIVVNNIIQNCIGSVDDEQNIQNYEAIYGQQYNDILKKKSHKGSIIVSELNDLQKIQKIPNYKIYGIYKQIRLTLKKISMLCQIIVEHPIFQALILLIIILNSIKMAFDDPLDTSTGTSTIENTFTVLYTMEMTIKIIAFGFILTPKSYLRDPWNILDFVIVSTSLLPIVVTINFSVNSLRAIRVLRPLKTITKVKSLKMIVSTLFFSFSLVMDSLYILFFVIIVFSIAGTQLFSGLLQNRCMDVTTGELTDILCSTGSTCDNGYLCARGIENPNFSINNFDTIIWSMLSVFRTLTLEGWSDIMIGLQQSYSQFSFIYSLMIVFFCEYVLLNMTLAILKYKYSQVKGNTIEEQEEEVNQYEPQFLKKIGVYNQVSKLINQPPLTRYICDIKNFVGSYHFYKDTEQVKNYDSYNLTLSRLQGNKNDQRKNTNLKLNKGGKIDIQELKTLGKVHEHKWDAKALEFESLYTEQNGTNVEQKNKTDESQKHLKEGIQEQENISQFNSDDNSSYEDDEQKSNDSSSSQLSMRSRNLIADKLYEVQKKLGNSTKHIKFGTNNFIRSNKVLPELNIEANVVDQNEDVKQLDNMLKLIGQSPGSSLTNNKYMVHLPEVDFQQMQVDKLYQRFNDLGQYRIKRVEKVNELNNFQIKHNKKRNIPQIIKKKQNLIQQMISETQLDLKQLQLVNQLSKKQLKFRIKTKSVLDESKTENSYDITRVIVSQKVKQIQKREGQILENMNSLNFHVTYKDGLNKDENESIQQSMFRRNLNNQLQGLKLPQMIKQAQTKKCKTPSATSLKSEANNTYLKLLQTHQMQEKIQMKMDRIMQIFFKKQIIHKKQVNKNQPPSTHVQNTEIEEQQNISLIEQYKKIKQDDIFHHQGKIFLEPPYQNSLNMNRSVQDILEKINMKSEEYQIYMKGLLGIINVIRKKTLLFVTRPLYDNSMLLLVIFNTVILSMNGFVDTDQSPYSTINTVFTFLFTADLVLKVFAFGMGFFGDIMNLFDSFVVCISIVQLSFGPGGGANLSALRAVRILRAFRVLRITRLIRTLNYMRIVMSVVSSIITQFVYIFMLLSLFMFIYTLLGMQIFGGQFLPYSVTGIRQSFDTFFSAFFTVFQVLTVQNWNDIQTLVLTSQTGTWSIIYLISWIFIGNWILLNLLQAILLDGFDKDSDIFKKNDNTSSQEEIVQIQNVEDQKNQTENFSIQSDLQQKKFSSEDASLFIFPLDNFVRKGAIALSSSKIFENIIVLMIALSSVKLVMDTYVTTGSKLETIADILDYIFNFIFIFQSLLKIIAQGLILGENAYLKSTWSKLDFFIVSTAVIDMSLGVDLSILKIFRTLRPLRIISRNPDMKIIISSLGESMLGILNVLIIIMCIFLMIGILGVNLLGGKLNYCNPSSQLVHTNYGPYGIDQEECQSAGGVWTTQLINFDNIGNSFLSLYVFSTRENWPFYALTFMDATQDGPVKDSSQLVFLIFSVVIIFVCSYFFMDLLVGVLFMNFHQAQQKIRPKKLTDKQINWKNLQKIIVQEDPCFQLFLKPQNKFSQFFYNIVHIKWFDIFITLCIVGNIVVMMVGTNDQTQSQSNTLDRINFIFSLIFIMECILKLSAFGKGYFLSGWNVFDFFVVMASILDIILQYTGAKTSSSSALSILPQIARIFRVLRVTKLLRMFKRFKGLQKLIETFLFSLPALAKGLSIVSLFLFIFSVLASFLFSNITGDYSGSFNEIKNFQNFHSSFETLFIMTTGQNWYFFMYQTILSGYVTCQQGKTCVQWYYLVFWLVYVFFSQKVFMELFVLIVLDQFEANYINQNNPLGIFSLFQDDFRNNWIQMTSKYHSEKIQTKRLLDFLLVLKQPLGLGKNELMIKYEDQLRQNQKITEEEVQHSLNELDVKLKKNAAKLLNKISIIKNRMYLGYHQTFYNFAKLSIASDFLDNASEEQKVALQQMHKQSEEALQKLKPEGNLYFYQQENNENSQKNETLNPIELILFCQMIVKSWHNYSLKYHLEKKQPKTKIQDNSLYNSLNNSCASDIEQAKFEKMQNQKKYLQRKGLLERRGSSVAKKQSRQIPNVQEHYKNDRKKIKTKLNKKKSTVQRSSVRDGSLMIQNSGIKIRISSLQNQE